MGGELPLIRVIQKPFPFTPRPLPPHINVYVGASQNALLIVWKAIGPTLAHDNDGCSKRMVCQSEVSRFAGDTRGRIHDDRAFARINEAGLQAGREVEVLP